MSHGSFRHSALGVPRAVPSLRRQSRDVWHPGMSLRLFTLDVKGECSSLVCRLAYSAGNVSAGAALHVKGGGSATAAAKENPRLNPPRGLHKTSEVLVNA